MIREETQIHHNPSSMKSEGWRSVQVDNPSEKHSTNHNQESGWF
jgi:hypothetical protein